MTSPASTCTAVTSRPEINIDGSQTSVVGKPDA